MNAAKQAGWLFGLLISLACSGWYFASSHSEQILDEQALLGSVDTVVNNLNVRQFSSSGLLINALESPEMTHIPKGNTNFFKNPHIISSQDNESEVDIRSQKARSIDGGKKITFIGEVVIHQAKSLKNEESTFKTEELDYFPEQKFATTLLPVILEQPGTTVHALGMNAYLEKKQIHLNHTKAFYKPR